MAIKSDIDALNPAMEAKRDSAGFMIESVHLWTQASVWALFRVATLAVYFAAGVNAGANDAQVVPRSIESLASAMDQFHTRFPVYDDVSSAGNHFHALAKFPDENARVTITGSYSLDRHSGATSIRSTFAAGGRNFGGFVFQNGVLPSGKVAPVLNFGTDANAGYDLTGATSLTFWARGQHGGEIVDFFMGGVGWNGSSVNNPCTPTVPGPCPFPDSTPAVQITVTLTTQWTQFAIDLSAKNLGYVLGGFGWGVDGAKNPGGATFLVDDIQYNLDPERRAQRLNQPRFIPSFTTLALQPSLHDGNPDDDIDLVLRNTAFVYDNSVSLLAFLADGSADSLRRARLIGDALIYASSHDRTFTDGRLRSAYGAGDIALPPGWTPNNRAATVPVAGFYEDLPMQFSELSESRTIDTGNQAWAMVSLLALHRRTGDTRYLDAARLLGNLIHGFRNNGGTYRGFLGGLDYANGDALAPNVRAYASAEHNLDIYAAFTRMFELTGEAIWQADARHARQFVEAMWDSAKACYWAGTDNPSVRNERHAELPLDVQAWSVLAAPDALVLHPQVLMCAQTNHSIDSDGFSGFDFNTDKDGIWFEGTAQMATAYAWANQPSFAATYRQQLARAQVTPPLGDGTGITAASHDAVTTGFGFKLFRREHTGATAWNVFAQLGFNPYYQTFATPTEIPRLVNISTRARVQVGDSVMIAGFIIGGDRPKKILITARGPSLAVSPFNVPGTLADPFMQLFSGPTQIDFNDDYQSRANAGEIPAAIRPPNAKEAAILTTLNPGAYTAIVTGVGATSGVGIVEVFEIDLPENPLINLSTRSRVETGDNVMIGGFIIHGNSSKTVLVTARGPSLAAAPFNVPGTLADPYLRLYSGQTVIHENDNWGDGANASQIPGTLKPKDPKDAAVLVTLAPGAYTVIVGGGSASTASGVAIVEVFVQ